LTNRSSRYTWCTWCWRPDLYIAIPSLAQDRCCFKRILSQCVGANTFQLCYNQHFKSCVVSEAFSHTHTRTYAHAYRHTQTLIQAYTHMQNHTHTKTHLYTRTLSHSENLKIPIAMFLYEKRRHQDAHTDAHRDAHENSHMGACSHAHTRTCAHAHMRTTHTQI